MSLSAATMPTVFGAIKVVEVTSSAVGRFAGRVLLHLGAEVVRVLPREDDGWAETDHADAKPLQFFLDAGKHPVAVGQHRCVPLSAVMDLVASSDILLTDLPAGSVPWGGSEQLLLVNPGLVVTSITPFGTSGPLRRFHGSSLVMAHACGEAASLAVDPGPDGAPRGPVKPGGYVNEYTTGLQAALATLAALFWRLGTGSGQCVEVNGLEANMFADPVAIGATASGDSMGTSSNGSFEFLGDRIPCKDGYVNFYLGSSERFWSALVTMMGLPAWATSSEVSSAEGRAQRTAELNRLIARWASRLTMRDISELALRCGCPAGMFSTTGDLLASPQLHARGFFLDVEGADGTRYMSPGQPCRFRVAPLGGGAVRLEGPIRAHSAPETVAALAAGAAGRVSRGREAETSSPGVGPLPGESAGVDRGPLAGVFVLDFSWWWAGPYATHLLGLLGASVVKVESATALDGMRLNPIGSPLPAGGLGDGQEELERQVGFHDVNLNKLSICLNLRHHAARRVVRDLAARADLVVENFRPGTMARLGLGYQELSRSNPRLVMLSVSAAGHEGPESSAPGFALAFQALGGLGTLTGYPDGRPVNVASGTDIRAGIWAAVMALAGLYQARSTGAGAFLDFSARESVTCLIGEEVVADQLLRRPSARRGNRDLLHAPEGCYPCLGHPAWVAVSILTEMQWRGLCAAIGQPHLAEDPLYLTASQRRDRHDELDALLAAWSCTRGAWEAAWHLQRNGVPAFPTLSHQEVVDLPHVRERGAIVEVDHPVLGHRRVMGPPWRFSRTPPAIWKAAPLLGEDTELVLQEMLGMSEGDVAGLRSQGAPV